MNYNQPLVKAGDEEKVVDVGPRSVVMNCSSVLCQTTGEADRKFRESPVFLGK